jgi:hypothetical protein
VKGPWVQGQNPLIDAPAPGPNPIQTDPATGITYAWNGYGWVPLVAPPPAGNGFAVAGFVLALLAVLCGFVPFFFVLTWILAVLGLVFGLVGLSRARSTPSRPHMGVAVAAVALSAVAAVMGVGGMLLTDHVFDEIREDIRGAFGPADPSTYDLGSVSCSVDGTGSAVAVGNITNTTNVARSFGVVVEFEEPNGAQQRSRGFILDVPPGGSSDWQVETIFDVAAGTDCRVVEVMKLL